MAPFPETKRLFLRGQLAGSETFPDYVNLAETSVAIQCRLTLLGSTLMEFQGPEQLFESF